jgi:hypothetical protein
MAEESQTEDTMIAALLREREGYVSRGLDDRVAQVDEQLAYRGYTAPKSDDDKPTAPAAAKAPASRSTPPKARRARGSETT